MPKYINRSRSEEIKQAFEALDQKYLEMFENIQPKGSPEVFGHMDTSTLNFLYVESEDRVVIIDYDYSGYSYRGYDIALLLQDVKYDYNHPQYPFFTYEPGMEPSNEIVAQYVKAYDQGIEMFFEVKRCMIATHYF